VFDFCVEPQSLLVGYFTRSLRHTKKSGSHFAFARCHHKRAMFSTSMTYKILVCTLNNNELTAQPQPLMNAWLEWPSAV